MIFAKAVEGSSEVIPVLWEKDVPKLLVAIRTYSSTKQCFAQLLHWQRLREHLGEAHIGVCISNPICGNPFQRVECSNGQMKTGTLDAVGLRNVYGTYSRGWTFSHDFTAELEAWSANNPSSIEKSQFKTTDLYKTCTDRRDMSILDLVSPPRGTRKPPVVAQCPTTSRQCLGSLWCLLACIGLDQADRE